jgi:hypothetical protein
MWVFRFQEYLVVNGQLSLGHFTLLLQLVGEPINGLDSTAGIVNEEKRVGPSCMSLAAAHRICNCTSNIACTFTPN